MFLEDRSQEGKKFLDLLRVLLNGYILAELLHKFHVVHECPHLPGQGREIFSYGRQRQRNTGVSVFTLRTFLYARGQTGKINRASLPARNSPSQNQRPPGPT